MYQDKNGAELGWSYKYGNAVFKEAGVVVEKKLFFSLL